MEATRVSMLCYGKQGEKRVAIEMVCREWGKLNTDCVRLWEERPMERGVLRRRTRLEIAMDVKRGCEEMEDADMQDV